MYRVRYGWKRWRNRWPVRWFFPPTVDERMCPKCGVLRQDGSQLRVQEQFLSGNALALVFSAGTWAFRRHVVEFLLWKESSREFCLPEYVPEEDLSDYRRVVAQTCEYLGVDSTD